ncbi:MAG: hypothetical protein WBS20_15875 [Lysobacterales bacterium]
MKKYLYPAIMVLFLLPLQAVAELYGTILGPTSTLVELDPVTGSVINTVGDVGYRVNGMTFDFTTGTLYATTSQGDANFPNGLITINLATGAGTTIGVGAGQLVNVPAVNSSGELYGWSEASDDPVLWNKVAGTVTVLGDSGLSSAEQSLSFDGSDTLYYVSLCCEGIQIIDTTTGAATPGPAITGATGNALHHGDFAPGTTLLYAMTETNDSSAARNIDILDVTTGNVVNTISSPDNLHTLAFTGPVTGVGAATGVPTMSFYGIVLAMLGLLFVASRYLRGFPRRS